MQCVLRCHPQRFFAQPHIVHPVPPAPSVTAAAVKLVSTSRQVSSLSLATACKHQQSRSRQTSHFLPTRGDQRCYGNKGPTTAGQESRDIHGSLVGSAWLTKRSMSTAGYAGAKRQTALQQFPHPGPSSISYRFGNNWQRPFNSSRTAPATTTNAHQRSFSTCVPAYNKNSSIAGLDSLQTWRRPYHYPSSIPQEARSLATMPSKPTLQAIPNSISDPATRLQRSLSAVPHHNIKNEIKLRCTEFDHKGNVKTTAGEFLKSDLCQQHGLHARDLRKIDSSFNNQMPVLLVRPEAILVNLGHIRALIKADLVVLFDSFGSTDSYNQSIFIYDLEEKLRMSTNASGGLPFEFRALEAILISVISSLQSEMEVLVHFVTKLLAHLEESIDQNKLKELLQYSKKLSQFESKTLLIRDVFVEVLDQDDDLANMYLTEKKLGRPRTEDSHEEIEILLESYLKQVEEIANTVSIVKQQMQSTEEIVNVILGANRNQLLLFELRIAMGTLGMSSGAIIASLYGMNLHNYLETNPHAFAIVGSTALGISMMVFAFCSRKLKMLAKGTT
ncbi:magnesium ion transporter [Linnemannia exigua]|uniref:Magnesium transporter n=1 Tax=Linnemannia exigua TaxID=604196 RepID=A0AAD4D9E4_9FUNG|nr:magnesium ion transporter [Linnemannia exigua]